MVFDIGMAALLALATLVQLNDPDPLPWVAIYGSACILSVTVAVGRPAPGALAFVVGAAALAWGLLIAAGGPVWSEYGHMFDAWEMQSVGIEEAREATGLLIVAGWMTVLALRSKWFRRAPRQG